MFLFICQEIELAADYTTAIGTVCLIASMKCKEASSIFCLLLQTLFLISNYKKKVGIANKNFINLASMHIFIVNSGCSRIMIPLLILIYGVLLIILGGGFPQMLQANQV